MYYEDRVVCYLDILAFKSHVGDSLNDKGEDIPAKIADMAQLIYSTRDLSNTDTLDERSRTEVTQFSDCVVISFKADVESGVYYALSDIMSIQLNMVRRGYLCRGGIARGKVVHTPTLLFGPAMNQAYLLELNSAVYPRVILDESIIRTGIDAHGRHHLRRHEEEAIRNFVSLDHDGFYYVDYIASTQSELDDPELDYPEYLSKIHQIITDGLRANSPSIKMKYKWMADKFQPHFDSVKESVKRTYPKDHPIRKAYESIGDFDLQSYR
jgi:hypothetical protein